jgi:hypothetical protein
MDGWMDGWMDGFIDLLMLKAVCHLYYILALANYSTN